MGAEYLRMSARMYYSVNVMKWRNSQIRVSKKVFREVLDPVSMCVYDGLMRQKILKWMLYKGRYEDFATVW